MYNTDFFSLYNSYLQENSVRNSHDRVFNLIKNYNTCFENVLDLGCGICEYLRYATPKKYSGVDKYDNGASLLCNNYNNASFSILDYRKDSLIPLVVEKKPLSFISLFSIENTGTIDDNYKLYSKLFQYESIQAGLSVGFYYSDERKQHKKITEAGSITSFQTIESLEESHIIGGIDELRIITKTPSKLFGNAVIEVWKLFIKNKII